MAQTIKITRAVAKKVLAAVDAGLVCGLGTPQPGKMCVEAAVCYALGLPHGDNPSCVAPSLRSLKIRLNDSNWSSDLARAMGMRKLAVLQLGTAGLLDEKKFVRRVVDMTIRKIVPRALLSAANVEANAAHKEQLKGAAKECAEDGTRESALKAKSAAAYAAAATPAAYAAADAVAAAVAAADANAAVAAAYTAHAAVAAAAAYAAAAKENASDESLAFFADEVAQILIDMMVPGIEWLDLLEAA